MAPRCLSFANLIPRANRSSRHDMHRGAVRATVSSKFQTRSHTSGGVGGWQRVMSMPWEGARLLVLIWTSLREV